MQHNFRIFPGFQILAAQTARVLDDAGSTTDATLATFLCLTAQVLTK